MSNKNSTQGEFTPFQIIEIEISQAVPALQPNDYPRQQAMVMVRLHTHPVGVFEMEIEMPGLSPERFAEQIWSKLGDAINAHLRKDRQPAVKQLSPDGISPVGTPMCIQQRDEFLANAPYASVLVATHNRLDTLGPCLDSILASEYPHFEVIVIDNAPSNQETAKFISQNYSGRVRYVREDHAGLASAHNCGLAAAHAPYVVITDDDVLVDRYWLVEMMQGFTRAENVGCVTGMIFPAEIATKAQDWIEHSVGYAKGYEARPFNLKEYRPDNPLFPYAAGMFGSGANMAFRSDVLRALGGFDDSLGAGSIALGGDDLASFYSVVAAGYTLVYEPAAIIYHRHHREYDRLRKTAYGYGAGLTAYLTGVVLKHPGRIFDIMRRMPLALRHALSSKSTKNARKAADYPGELTKMERKGMLAGPGLYLRSRWHSRRIQKQHLEAIRFEQTVLDIERGNR